MNYETTSPRQRLLDVVPLSAPYTLYIDPSGCCNFKCCFCPCNNSNYKAEERHQIMRFSLFEKIVEDIKQLGRIKSIKLYDFGEPLLNKRFIEMVRLLKINDVCEDVRTVTNGSLLNPEINRQLVESGIDRIQISVEALRDSDYMDVCGVVFSVEQLVANVTDLYEQSRGTGTKVSVKAITSKISSAEQLRYFEQLFEPISDNCWYEEQFDAWPYFQSERVIAEKSVEGLRFSPLEKREAQNRICPWPLTNMTVFSNGKVGVCCNDWRMDTVVGDVNIQTLRDIWNGDKMNRLRLNLLSNDRNNASESCMDCLQSFFDDIDADAKAIIQKFKQK